MLFYPSKNNDKLNRQSFVPEAINGRVMINPKYPVRSMAPDALAVMDSGAFQDVDDGVRLLPWSALDRQLRYEERLRWHNPHFRHCEALVIYDQMAGVDEQVINGKKVKVRGTRESAARAVEETLFAAQYYASQRARVEGRICFVGQGINPDQYIDDCLVPMLDTMQAGDWFGFGGFCIVGRVPSLKPLLYETFERALPLLKKRGVSRLHLLGVTVADCSRVCAGMARCHGFELSVDSSGPERNACAFGKRFINEVWKQAYSKEEKYVTYHPCQLAIENIRDYHEWSARL